MELINSKTLLNLAKTYAGECQARARYDMIEYGSRQQHYTALADLVKKVATNEFNHARMFYSFIVSASKDEIVNVEVCSGYPFKEKWDLLDNFKFAAEDEENEQTKIYPEYERIARKEGFEDIANLYKNVISVENCHKMLFQQIYDQMKNGTMYKKTKAVKWKCNDCGYEETSKEAWTECPLCLAKQGAVMLKIEDNS